MVCWGRLVFSAALFAATVCSFTDGDSRNELPIQTSCEVERAEIVKPRITATTGGNLSQSWKKMRTEPPQTFHVTLRWRGRERRVTLFQSDVIAGNMAMVYDDTDQNDTVAETEPERCYYHGFVKKEKSSYAALSTCDGLAGYIQTDEEMLFIEPSKRRNSRPWYMRPHIIYTCRENQPLSGNFTDTEEPLPAADPRLRRRKRSVGRKRYLEVQVVVDHTVIAMHGKERVKNYVITVMNIANSVYQHHTLGVNLRVVVTEIILLSKDDQKRVMIKRNPHRTLKQFCQWSMNRQLPSNAKHDIAVLLTREKMGPAGFAPLTGLCNASRSCAVITDEGFTSGFIIAHEMAHVIGLSHDGHGSPCTGRRYMSAIMAPLVQAKLNHYWWSECSQRQMQHVINHLYCLNDEPDMTTDVKHYELDSGYELADNLGSHWSLDFQCRLEFSDSFGLCKKFSSDHCNMLWCSDRRTPHLCRTKKGPPAPGTNCGRDRECRDWRCTYVGNEDPVHGNWSSWAEWEKCSVQCGTGIKKRHRLCNNPKPAFGGKECTGEEETWDTCISKECDSYYDSREGHCAVWNEIGTIYDHDWKAYQAKKESDRCKQTCFSALTKEALTIDVDVSDGTPCDYDHPTNICYQGTCLAVGCDGIRNSTKEYDSCGVCGGDNSQCKVVSGLYQRVPAKKDEYEAVIVLPKGSRNIEIVKRGNTKHFIALRDADHGTYPLNGNKGQENSREFIHGAARFVYTSKPGIQNLTSRGPIYSNLEVMLYPNGDMRRASVTYEYSISKHDFTFEKRKYQWRVKGRTDCSVTCGEGVTKIEHACHDKDTEAQVDNEKCQYLDAPQKDEEKCSREPCSQRRYMWAMTNDWSECSAKGCGETGEQTQGYICQLYFMNNDTYQDVDLHLCDQKSTPHETKNCSSPPCQLLNRTTGEWLGAVGCDGVRNSTKEYDSCGVCGGDNSQCKVVSGHYKKVPAKRDTYEAIVFLPKGSRNIEIVNRGNTKHFIALRDADHGTYPLNGNKRLQNSREFIQDGTRFVYTRKPGIQSLTSRGPTHSNLEVMLYPGRDMRRASVTYEYSISKDDFTFEKRKYQWRFKGWNNCSVKCGEGVTTIEYACHDKDTGDQVDNEKCKYLDPPRKDEAKCFREPCLQRRYMWAMTNDWSECSAKGCGEEGEQTQGYTCQLYFINNTHQDVDLHLCDQKSTPHKTRNCSSPPCQHLNWTIGDWAECSVTCGKGRQRRRVYCGDPDTDSDDILCKDIPPPLSRTCKKKRCKGAPENDCRNKYSFCSLAKGLSLKCKSKGFREICCKACKLAKNSARTRRMSKWAKYRMRMRRRRYY